MPLFRGSTARARGSHLPQYASKCYYKRSRTSQYRKLGQSLIETMAGFMLLIPLALFSYDLTFILIANQNNERVAENAARAAANHVDADGAQQAAQQAIDDFKQSSTFNNITLNDFVYNLGVGQVSLVTRMTINLPVPLFSWQTLILNAPSLQPIVATPAPI